MFRNNNNIFKEHVFVVNILILPSIVSRTAFMFALAGLAMMLRAKAI